jgi:hypothetical protein
MLREGREQVLDHHRNAIANNRPLGGDHVMYFETGQGSALSAEAHHGVDQLTLEAGPTESRAPSSLFWSTALSASSDPEYLYERQIIRAGLEDHFMGKLLGLPMGCDVCYTNHAAADQNSADNLLLLLTAAGCNYFMGVPCSDDVMLNYQSTSYHDALAARRLFQLRPAPEFLAWLQNMGIYRGTEPASLDSSSRRGAQLMRGFWRRRWNWRFINPCLPKITNSPDAPDHDLPEIVKKVRAQTPARLLAGRSGAAYRTSTQLELREAHAAARDAVRDELDLSRISATTSCESGICLKSAPRRPAKMNIFCART